MHTKLASMTMKCIAKIPGDLTGLYGQPPLHHFLQGGQTNLRVETAENGGLNVVESKSLKPGTQDVPSLAQQALESRDKHPLARASTWNLLSSCSRKQVPPQPPYHAPRPHQK